MREKENTVRRAKSRLNREVRRRTAHLAAANIRLRREMRERREAEEERERMREKLARQEKMEALGLMAGQVAHDLNNILAGIISYPELMLLDLPAKSPLREPLEAIIRAGKRAAAVVEDLLSLARNAAASKKVLYLNDLLLAYLESPEFKRLQTALSQH